jgi:hypothetical protein
LGESEEPIDRANITGYDANKVGKQTLTITKRGRTATFDVDVSPLIGALNGTWKYRTTDPNYGLPSEEFTLNNGAFTYKFTGSVIAALTNQPQNPGTVLEIKGTYTIAKLNGAVTFKHDPFVDTLVQGLNSRYTISRGSVVDGKEQLGLAIWPSYSISIDPSPIMYGTIKGTVLELKFPRSGDTTHTLYFVK